MIIYRYGDYLPNGELLDKCINKDLNSLEYLIRNLNNYNYNLTAINSEGIIIDYKHNIVTDYNCMQTLDRIDNIESKIDILISTIETQFTGDINSLNEYEKNNLIIYKKT